MYRQVGWTVVHVKGVVLAYSKEPNSLPVTTTKLSISMPCVNPYETAVLESTTNNLRYIGDIDYNLQNCSTFSETEDGSRYYLDKRFKRSGLRISMYNLQNESTVLTKLEN